MPSHNELRQCDDSKRIVARGARSQAGAWERGVQTVSANAYPESCVSACQFTRFALRGLDAYHKWAKISNVSANTLYTDKAFARRTGPGRAKFDDDTHGPPGTHLDQDGLARQQTGVAGESFLV